MEYKGIDNNKDIAYNFENLSININNNCIPRFQLFYIDFK